MLSKRSFCEVHLGKHAGGCFHTDRRKNLSTHRAITHVPKCCGILVIHLCCETFA